MLEALKRRAAKAGLQDRIETRLCAEDQLGIADLANAVDLVAAVHVVHETRNQGEFLRELADRGPSTNGTKLYGLTAA